MLIFRRIQITIKSASLLCLTFHNMHILLIVMSCRLGYFQAKLFSILYTVCISVVVDVRLTPFYLCFNAEFLAALGLFFAPPKAPEDQPQIVVPTSPAKLRRKAKAAATTGVFY